MKTQIKTVTDFSAKEVARRICLHLRKDGKKLDAETESGLMPWLIGIIKRFSLSTQIFNRKDLYNNITLNDYDFEQFLFINDLTFK
jgi:hypothetical protein